MTAGFIRYFVMPLLYCSLLSLMERELYLETCSTRISLLLLCNCSVDLHFLHLSLCFFFFIIIRLPVTRGSSDIRKQSTVPPPRWSPSHRDAVQNMAWHMSNRKRFAAGNLQGKLVTSPLSSDFLGAPLSQHKSPLREI